MINASRVSPSCCVKCDMSVSVAVPLIKQPNKVGVRQRGPLFSPPPLFIDLITVKLDVHYGQKRKSDMSPPSHGSCPSQRGGETHANGNMLK